MKKGYLVILAVLALMFMVACGGGGGGTGDATGGNTGGNTGGDPGGGGTTPAQPAFAGFDFTLSQGDFWEYQWDYYYNSWYQGGTPSTTRDIGRIRAVLGTPVTIGGIQAFPVTYLGRTGLSPTTDFQPRWNYLAMDSNKMLGSVDGNSLSIIFDAQEGFWPGGGFFADFGNSALVQGTSSTISNDYINTSTIKIGFSDSQSQCEYYPGIGNICGDSSYNWTENDHFVAGVGPVGYRYYNAFSDCGGNFCSGSTKEVNTGLVLSSFWGDSPTYDLEVEPDDSLATAMSLVAGQEVLGNIDPFDPGYDTMQIAGADYYGEYQVEDLYKIVVPPLGGFTRNISVSLHFEGTPSVTDLDLYLFNSSGTQVTNSIRDNAGENYYVETINASVAGTFYVGVEAFRTDSNTAGGRVEYTLTVNW